MYLHKNITSGLVMGWVGWHGLDLLDAKNMEVEYGTFILVEILYSITITKTFLLV